MSESPGGLLKYRLLGLSPSGFASVGHPWGCSGYVSSRFPGLWHSGLEPHFEKHSYSTAASACPLTGHLCVPGVCVLSRSCRPLCDPRDCGPPGSCAWDFPRTSTGVGAISSSGGLPDPATKPASPVCLELAGRFFTAELWGRWWNVLLLIEMDPNQLPGTQVQSPSLSFFDHRAWSLHLGFSLSGASAANCH